MPNYGEAQYWEERYGSTKQVTFDWLESWAEVKDIIEKHCMHGLYDKDGISVHHE